MQFTLDSIEQYKSCLQEIYKGRSINYTSFFTSDLNDLIQYTENTLYFGLITVGTNVISCVLKNENDDEIITIEANSQIIDAFSSLELLDALDVALATPSGHFRGFEINIR